MAFPAREYEISLIEPELEDYYHQHKKKGRTVCDYYGQFLDQDPVYEPQQDSCGKQNEHTR